MRILIIAYDFPPCHSSGVQRTLKFAENLTELGWDVLVLTADENSYERVDNSQIVSEKLIGKIYRAKCINLKKTMSYKGKYFSIVEKFEKIWPWYYTGKRLGVNVIKEFKPDVIFSTYPVFTAHCIAYYLASKFEIPWVMDYRDPLRQHYDPSYKNLNFVFSYLERKFIDRCSKAIFTSEASKDFYGNIYPKYIHKLETIRNGYTQRIEDNSSKDRILILHSGVLYHNDRNIDEFIYAIHEFLEHSPCNRAKTTVRFRGSTMTTNQSILIKKLKLESNFEFLQPVGYEDSLKEISTANILLVVQNGVLTSQIPGKIYEYIATRKKIICLTEKNSALHEIKWKNLHFCYDRNDIVKCLSEFDDNNYIEMDDKSEYQYTRFQAAKKLENIIILINDNHSVNESISK